MITESIIKLMTFAEWLERKYVEWRGTRMRGISIDAFARHLGVSQATMSRWLAGQKMPSRDAIAKIKYIAPFDDDLRLGHAKGSPVDHGGL